MKHREILFYLITILLILVIFSFSILTPFVYRKITKSYSYCGSYGETDVELGWVLKKSHISCLTFKNYLKNETYFDTKIFLNQYGFRDKKTINNQTPKILFIGDSWTFGYGVDYEDTIAAIIERKTGMSAFNLGVPNYSSLQTFYLFNRFKNKFKPEYIIYLNSGVWNRALCSKELYNITLEPCYTIINNEVNIKFPNKKFLKDSIESFRYPSGMLTSGYNLFHFLFFIKPRDLLIEVLAKLGIKDFFPNAEVSANHFSDNELKSIKNKEIEMLKEISSPNTKFVNIMMYGDNYIDQKLSNFNNDKNFIHLNHAWFDLNINQKLNDLENKGRIIIDGHFNESANELIAEQIISVLGLK